MHGSFSSGSMEVDASDLSHQLWDLHRNNNSPKLKFEFTSSRVLRDDNMIELGKKLLLKSKLGKTEEVKELMSLGAPFTADWVGTSPLHWAAHFNHVEVTDLLLRAGICRNAKNKVDRTPLHIASQNGHVLVVQLLLQFGADVNCKDMLKMTPLHWAAENGFKDCVQTLIDYGADLNASNKFEKTPAKLASDQKHYSIAQLLENAASIEPSLRASKLNTVQHSPKSNKSGRTSSNNLHRSSGNMLKVIGRRKKIGIMLSKNELKDSAGEDESKTSRASSPSLILGDIPDKNPLELLQAHGITMLEPDSSTTISTAIESGQTVMLTEAGKLALGFSKNVEKDNEEKPLNNVPLNQKLIIGKKVITIRADQLINMTKERKVIIKQGKPISANRIFQGKLYSPEEEDLLIERLTSKIAETTNQVEVCRAQLEKIEKEAESYKRQLESIKNSRSKADVPKEISN